MIKAIKDWVRLEIRKEVDKVVGAVSGVDKSRSLNMWEIPNTKALRFAISQYIQIESDKYLKYNLKHEVSEEVHKKTSSMVFVEDVVASIKRNQL